MITLALKHRITPPLFFFRGIRRNVWRAPHSPSFLPGPPTRTFRTPDCCLMLYDVGVASLFHDHVGRRIIFPLLVATGLYQNLPSNFFLNSVFCAFCPFPLEVQDVFLSVVRPVLIFFHFFFFFFFFSFSWLPFPFDECTFTALWQR